MYINDLDIQISLQTKAVETANFNLALILGSRARNHDLVGHYGLYSDLASLKEAGFVANDPEYKMLSKLFSQSPKPKNAMVYVGDSSKNFSERISNASAQNAGWYILFIAERGKADLHSAGDYCLSNEKLFIGCSADKTALTNRNNIREAYLIHNLASDYPEVAWAGTVITKPIGSYTWKYKKPAGVTASNFSLTVLQEIRTANGQSLSKRAGIVYSDNGITTGGEFIDIIQSRDYLQEQLEKEIFSLLTRLDKSSFDDVGFTAIEATIRSVLNQAGEDGIIAQAISDKDREASDEGVYMYTLSVPERSQISQNDKASRNLDGIKFNLTIAGAIHGVGVSGVITA